MEDTKTVTFDAELCAALPEGVAWGEPLTPAIAEHIARTFQTAADAPQVVRAALDLAAETGAHAFVIPVPNTTPELFVSFGERDQIVALTSPAKVGGDEYGVLHRMAYIMDMYPEGATIPFQVLEVLRNQYRAAMQARAALSADGGDRKDAERYRYLWSALKAHTVLGGVQYDIWFEGDHYDLDAYCDAAKVGSEHK